MKKPYSIDYDVFAKVVKMRRKELGLTQRGLSMFSGVSETHVSRLENGNPIGLETLVRICVYLEISIDDTLGLTFSDKALPREILDLFLTHTEGEQEIALFVMKQVFVAMELAEEIGRGKKLEDILALKKIDLEHVPPFQLFDAKDIRVLKTKKDLSLFTAAEDQEDLPPKRKKGTKE